MFPDFFDDFENIFDRLSSRFQRPVKDQNPFSVYSSEKGYIIVCNTLGIDKDDLKINVKKEQGNPFPVLSVSGSSRIEKINFSNNVDLRIRLRLSEKIDSVSYETKNGLTLVYLKTETKEPEMLEAKPIEDGDSLDW